MSEHKDKAVEMVTEAYQELGRRQLITFWKDFRKANAIAKRIASERYWEAHACENSRRMDYWFKVMAEIDNVTKVD